MLATEARRYAGIHDAAIFCGVSADVVRRWIRAGRLTRFVPTGGKVLVDLRELDQLIRASAGAESTRGQHLQNAAE
jgi:hypothetical protein